MIENVTNADAIPVLDRLMQFASARHRVIADNIANISTPGHRDADLSTEAFQAQLGKAIDARRSLHGGRGGELRLPDTDQVKATPTGLVVEPVEAGRNILFHDRNDRDLERSMQDLVENFSTFRMAAQFLRSRYDLINTAIRERL